MNFYSSQPVNCANVIAPVAVKTKLPKCANAPLLVIGFGFMLILFLIQ